MKPRHAELLASDLDTQTLIKYIDRFFYVLYPSGGIVYNGLRYGVTVWKVV